MVSEVKICIFINEFPQDLPFNLWSKRCAKISFYGWHFFYDINYTSYTYYNVVISLVTYSRFDKANYFLRMHCHGHNCSAWFHHQIQIKIQIKDTNVNRKTNTKKETESNTEKIQIHIQIQCHRAKSNDG